ncbi:MAG: hypothetical protein U9O94_11620 [Nanoarchaeota archaeon]|nr:hypothetical protein [Nanoarchaeota archaeon]
MKLPCDLCMWGLIPMIKRELVLRLYREHKLTKVAISNKLGITKGSVTQYMQGKRACDSSKLRGKRRVNSMIVKLSLEIANKKITEKSLSKKFCEICKYAQKTMGVC